MHAVYIAVRNRIIILLNDLLSASDNGQESVLVLLDMSAAFDTIDHNILLHRLQTRFGIEGTVIKWFSSYLHDRTQSVLINGSESNSHCLEYGVPQGSVLGPPEYTFYTSPISDIISSHKVDHMIYADDTQLYLSFTPSERSSAIQRLERCVSAVMDWATTNKLKINDSKTQIIHISSRFRECEPLPPLRIGTSFIHPVTSARNLWVTVDSNLDLKSHIRNMCNLGGMAYTKLANCENISTRIRLKNLHTPLSLLGSISVTPYCLVCLCPSLVNSSIFKMQQPGSSHGVNQDIILLRFYTVSIGYLYVLV